MLDSMHKKSSEKPCTTIDTLIGVNTEINGDIAFSGGLRIDGTVKGNITAKEDDNSTLVLSENATVVGDISAPHLIVNGTIQGNVHCAERIEMQPKAVINGDVTYRIIEMALGASINGKLNREAKETGENGKAPKLKAVGAEGDDQQ